MSEQRSNEALTALGTALASLPLKPSGLHRDRVMYLAGRASVMGAKGPMRSFFARWLWPLATAASLLLAATLGGVLLVSARPKTVERVVYVPVDRPDESTRGRDSRVTPSAESQGSPLRTDYLALRRLVLTRGVDDGLPLARAAARREGESLTPGDAYRGSIDLDHSS
jgi:hypothetical protein